MKIPDILFNEPERMAALCALEVLDTPAEARFDRITRIAQRHFQLPIALVSLVDAGRQWFKSRQGLDATETPRDISFCGHAILSEDILYVSDALQDPRFADNPLVTGGPGVRFYAGAPLHAPGGERIGTLCVIDTRPREFGAEDFAMLRDLADSVEAELDRTQLRTTQVQMHSAENRLRAVIDTVVDGIVTIDKRGVVQTFNPAAERIFGYAAADVIGHNVRMLMPEPYHSAHDGYLHNYFTTGNRKIIGLGREVTGQRQDGSTFPMELAVSEMEVNGERMFTGIVRDITERKAKESADKAAKLAERQLDLFREMVENTAQPIFLIDVENGYQLAYVNQAAIRHWGGSKEELLTWRIPDWDPTFDEERTKEHFAATVGKPGMLLETEHRLKDGRIVPVEVFVNARMMAGKPYIFGSFMNISARKQSEALLHSAKEGADRANRAKSEFLSSMSHELRTPLNAILGFAQILESSQKHPLDGRQKDHVRQILRGGQHLLDLINEVLDLARIEAGKLSLSIEAIELTGTIDECLSVVQGQADRYGIAVVAPVWGQTQLLVQADRIRLKQIFLNLLSNAIKYNRPEGKVTMVVAPASDGHIRIAVEDTGFGIAADKQKDLFKPFSRLGAETSEIEGTGIGLIITERLTQAMGGVMGFSSTPGEGSVFWVELPVASPSAHKEQSEIVPDVGAPVSTPPGAARRMLYIEDNPSNVQLLESIVEDIPDLDMVALPNAELGLDLAEREPPDLILLDMNLPGMNGIEAVRRLKFNPKTRNIPVLALSADAMPATIRKALDAGCVDYVTKPVNVARLLAAIDAAMKETTP